jgi:hypothetical protein
MHDPKPPQVEAAIRKVLASTEIARFDIAQRRMPARLIDTLTRRLLASDWSLMWADAHITDVLDAAPEYWGEGSEQDITTILTALQDALTKIGHPFTVTTADDEMLAEAHASGTAVHLSRCCALEPPHEHW